MSKVTERIALEEYNFVEVEADSFEEASALASAVRAAYEDRLHKPANASPGYQSDKPFPSGMQMEESGVTCDSCGSEMNLQTKTSKKSGKPYKAYFCPNSSMQAPHPLKFPS